MDSNTKKELISWLLALGVAISVGLGFREYCLEIYSVEGVSMLPTLSDDDRLIVEKVSVNAGEFKRGDIVVFHYPAQRDRYFVKRLIGLPGDTVEITHGKVIVNGVELNEFSYAMERPEVGFPKDKVPEGSYFVLGDNRNNSEDSRFSDVGYVNKPLVIGKAIYIAWPVSHIKSLELDETEPLVQLGGDK